MQIQSYYDVVIIGGGFYGCCLSLYLRKAGHSVALFEKENDILTHASTNNQARVHTGFHYPRSLTTAIRSLINFPHFVYDFRKAIVDDFTMLYAIARHGSKINGKRFFHMYKEMHAPIHPARKKWCELFSQEFIESVFEVKEYAFDHCILRKILNDRMHEAGIAVFLESKIQGIVNNNAQLQFFINEQPITATHIFNCTYSGINTLLDASSIPLIGLKHEITEMALVEPPPELQDLAITVMDGPFFSIMPYPAQKLYTLSHVRYTPHKSWTDSSPCVDGHELLAEYHKKTNFPYMLRDVTKFVPCLNNCKYIDSIFEIKTVLLRNENDDGRPIFIRTHDEFGNIYSIMGSKIDNVYDLFIGLGSIKDFCN